MYVFKSTLFKGVFLFRIITNYVILKNNYPSILYIQNKVLYLYCNRNEAILNQTIK